MGAPGGHGIAQRPNKEYNLFCSFLNGISLFMNTMTTQFCGAAGSGVTNSDRTCDSRSGTVVEVGRRQRVKRGLAVVACEHVGKDLFLGHRRRHGMLGQSSGSRVTGGTEKAGYTA